MKTHKALYGMLFGIFGYIKGIFRQGGLGRTKSASALVSPDGQMFFGTKSLHFDF
jgi:hypothetical protein